MSQVAYKPEKCSNCGDNRHCGSSSYRDERDYDGNYHVIKVCDSCSCDKCTSKGYQDA